MLDHVSLNRPVAPVLAPQTQPHFSHRQLLLVQLQKLQANRVKGK